MTPELLILDLDGTLYTNHALTKLYENCFEEFVAGELGVSRSLLLSRIGRMTDEYEKSFPCTPSRLSFLSQFGIPLERWFERSIRHINPQRYLRKESGLCETLSQLSSINVVCTNNCRLQAERTLEALGVASCIDKIFSPDHPDMLKPSEHMYRQILDHYGISAANGLVLGDRLIDILPARSLGIPSVQVGVETLTSGSEGCREILTKLCDMTIL